MRLTDFLRRGRAEASQSRPEMASRSNLLCRPHTRSSTGRIHLIFFSRSAIVWALGMLMLGLNLFIATAKELKTLTFEGLANASGGVALDEQYFAIAGDEMNDLFIYLFGKPGGPVSTQSMGSFLALSGHSLEVDWEAAAKLGSRIYWLGSHSNAKDGKLRPNRHRLIATDIMPGTNDPPQLTPFGRPIMNLVESLLTQPFSAELGLGSAAMLPSDLGGINLEGMAATPTGGLLLGFRSPIPQGKALVIPIKNPEAAISGAPIEFGELRQLDLHGQGIREMFWTGKEYLLISGDARSGGRSHLFRWDGNESAPKEWGPEIPKDFNAEALIPMAKEGGNSLLVISDDGHRAEKDPRWRGRFRALVIPRLPK